MSAIPDEALGLLRSRLRRGARAGLEEPMAAVLATADARGRPSARVVLLKEAGAAGLVFYTNLDSAKGRQIAQNPRAALCFYWDSFWEQVRVEGRLRRVGDAEADAYWRTRPRDSQLGAWASVQSARLKDRRTLLARFSRFKRLFDGRPIPRPAHWAGFRLTADRIEFWKGRARRLHDRLVFERRGGRWTKGLLYP